MFRVCVSGGMERHVTGAAQETAIIQRPRVDVAMPLFKTHCLKNILCNQMPSL